MSESKARNKDTDDKVVAFLERALLIGLPVTMAIAETTIKECEKLGLDSSKESTHTVIMLALCNALVTFAAASDIQLGVVQGALAFVVERYGDEVVAIQKEIDGADESDDPIPFVGMTDKDGNIVPAKTGDKEIDDLISAVTKESIH